jgi:hypothetical protein
MDQVCESAEAKPAGYAASTDNIDFLFKGMFQESQPPKQHCHLTPFGEFCE